MTTTNYQEHGHCEGSIPNHLLDDSNDSTIFKICLTSQHENVYMNTVCFQVCIKDNLQCDRCINWTLGLKVQLLK